MRILSYNIQAAIHSTSYLSYTWQWPRQILPNRAKTATLERIAAFINAFDVVCLQEIELGGLRNGFKSQAEQLLALTDFRHAAFQTNRRLSRLSLHGNLILSKTPADVVLDTPLPGQIRGRGIIAVKSGDTVIATTHLSLGKLDQYRQLRYIRAALGEHPRVLLTGDLNCERDAAALTILTDHHYRLLGDATPTFPSWKPKKSLDHALAKGIAATSRVVPFHGSDHLPVDVRVYG
ncbi:MAG: endonuclease/exonuclease/phosphatase family protein [Cardiobacteriaceae bacterium]|nr:endonuclease/exonuclease/phosphatase family protein [Cardiobacteriaceae bacterium]